jgi:ligand-binding sensor domain-containing protein
MNGSRFVKFSSVLLLWLMVLLSCDDEKALPRPDAYWRLLTVPTGLRVDVINDLLVDQSGKIWAAFAEGGVGRFDGTQWTIFAPAPETGVNSGQVLYEDSHGNIWATVSQNFNTYACKFDGLNWTSSFIATDQITAITELQNGDMFFGGSSTGAHIFDGVDWTQSDCDTKCYYISAAFTDSDGILWIGKGGSGVVKFDGTTYTAANIPIPGNEAPGGVVNFTQGSSGDLIASLKPGTAWRMKEGVWQRIITDMTYPAGPALVTLEDSQGRIWIGTEDKGLILYDGAELITYTLSDRKSHIKGIVEDANGDIYLGNPWGLFKYEYY